MTTRRAILVEARTLIAGTATSRDVTQNFLEHLTNQPFEKSPISKRDGFEVTFKEAVLTSGFGITGQKEGEFMMVVRLGHAPFSQDYMRENLVADDVEKLADILEAHTWGTGVRAVWYIKQETNKNDANWWITVIEFRVVYTGALVLV